MKTTIGVYDKHSSALEAVKKLKNDGFPSKQLSILGKATSQEDDVHIASGEPAKLAAKEVGIGAVAGTVVGVLTGVGLFAIPGLGLLYGAGALVGAIAGFDLGIIGGGIATALTMTGMKDEHAKEYEKYLAEGKFIVVAQGSEEELAHAKDLLDAHGTHEYSGIKS